MQWHCRVSGSAHLAGVSLPAGLSQLLLQVRQLHTSTQRTPVCVSKRLQATPASQTAEHAHARTLIAWHSLIAFPMSTHMALLLHSNSQHTCSPDQLPFQQQHISSHVVMSFHSSNGLKQKSWRSDFFHCVMITAQHSRLEHTHRPPQPAEAPQLAWLDPPTQPASAHSSTV
jgi:hypothetical protein